ncbi:MAG: hypothetical protein KIT27_01795 [Legionellales bacterium]|nr:hypothetical protein [Legionellales bacterium]
MKKSTIIPMAFIIACFSPSVFAEGVHTWHNITADTATWNGRLIITSSNEQAFFTNKSGENEGSIYDFTLNPANPTFTYGFGFTTANFNVSYVLTLYQPQSTKSMFVSKACQFDVSAKGPANPDIRVEQYNGANCRYSIVSGVGENFEVS